MNTQNTDTKQTGKVLESHIMNGRANLNYNWEQFSNLTPDQQRDFIWFAAVHLDLTEVIKHTENSPKNHQTHFNLIQDKKQNFSAVNYRTDKVQEMLFNGLKVTSSAQAITLIAYGDSTNGNKAKIPFRNLDYNCKCENFSDFMECIKLIDSYNEFDASGMRNSLIKYLSLQQFYSADNCNNGNSVFSFTIGREGSPVLYVSYNEYFATKVIKDREGAEVYWEEFNGNDFKNSMQVLKNSINADEFSIETTDVFGKNHYTARFWFD